MGQSQIGHDAQPVLGVVMFTNLVGSAELRSSLGEEAADELKGIDGPIELVALVGPEQAADRP